MDGVCLRLNVFCWVHICHRQDGPCRYFGGTRPDRSYVVCRCLRAGVRGVGRSYTDVANITSGNLTWLGLSGVTTALSWIFYYKALKAGDVANVALIDKGSVIDAMLLAGLVLREIITLRMITGAGLIVAGLLVIAKKP